MCSKTLCYIDIHKSKSLLSRAISIVCRYIDKNILLYRYVGYSYISCARYAFPFEAMEVFTFFSLQVEKLQQQNISNI